MSYYAKCCEDCVLNHECLFQDDNDVESCGDYDYDEENPKQEKP